MAQMGSFALCLWLIVYLGMLGLGESSESIVPGMYIFGDSTVDVGTNNFLPDSGARADMYFNGIDFPSHKPTGRFSNGFNTADHIAMIMGFAMSPPPFLSFLDKNKQFPSSKISLACKGVNFASGGSGLLNDTGRQKWTRVVRFGEQVEQFATVHDNISKLLGEDALANISKSFFLVSVGSNDIFEHFLYNDQTPPQEFITSIMSTYESHLKNLIDLGAKKFGLISVPPIGCVPLQHNFTGNGTCFEPMNEFAKLFHTALGGLLQKLSSECKGMVYAIGDSYKMTNLVIKKPSRFGFAEVTRACCGSGNFNAECPCTPNATVCGYRGKYLFWDQFHPTEKASSIAALSLCTNKEFVAPMTFTQVAMASP